MIRPNCQKIKTPLLLDKSKLPGIGLTRINEEGEWYVDELYSGLELKVEAKEEKGRRMRIENSEFKPLIYVLAGTVTIMDLEAQSKTFYTEDFFVLPARFSRVGDSQGHEMFRSLRVKSAD